MPYQFISNPDLHIEESCSYTMSSVVELMGSGSHMLPVANVNLEEIRLETKLKIYLLINLG